MSDKAASGGAGGRAAEGTWLPQLAVVFASLLWGLWWIPVRALEQRGLEGDWVSVAVYGFGALGLLPLMLRQHRRFRQNLGTLAAAGLFCGAALAFWNHAILVGEVVRVTLLFYLAPIWSTLFAAVFLGERITLRRGLTIALGLSGAAIILGVGEGGTGLPLPRGAADWMAIAAGISFAASTTIIRGAGEGNSVPQSFATLLGAALVALALALIQPAAGTAGRELAAAALPLAAVVGILWLLPALWLVLWGAGQIDPGRVAILLLLEVVTAAASAAVLTDEPFGTRELAGCLLVLAAGLVEAGAGRPWALGVLLRWRRR